MAVMRVRVQDGIVPANGSFDIDTGDDVLFDGPGPFIVAAQYWVHTVGGASAGVFQLDFNYVDPLSRTLTVAGVGIFLQDPDAFHTIPLTPIARLNNSSLFQCQTSILGVPDGALVSYRVMILPGDIGETGTVEF